MSLFPPHLIEMRKLKPKYLFASAALLILLVVVVYVVTRSKETTPNGPSAGSDEVARTLDFGTPETPGSPEIQPVTAQPATPSESPYDVTPHLAPVDMFTPVERLEAKVFGLETAVKDIREAYNEDVGFLLDKVESLEADSVSSDLFRKVQDLEALAQSAEYRPPEPDGSTYILPLLEAIQLNNDTMQMQIDAISRQVDVIIASSGECMRGDL